MPEIVPLELAHLMQLFGHPPQITLTGFAVVEADRVLGVTAYYPDKGRFVVVAEIAADALKDIKRYRRTLIKAARAVLAQASARALPIHAARDTSIAGSEVLLSHLGFKRFYKETWAWHGFQ